MRTRHFKREPWGSGSGVQHRDALYATLSYALYVHIQLCMLDMIPLQELI